MKLKDLNKLVIENLLDEGFSGKLTSVKHVQDLKEEIERLNDGRLLDEEFYQRRLELFNKIDAEIMPDARAVIVVACPQPKSKMIFEYAGKNFNVTIPPTYIYNHLYSRVSEILNRTLNPYNFHIQNSYLPAKLLTVRTGLGKYGKNNITYVEGMGSFHRLFTFYTDMPPYKDNWKEKELLPECESCYRCIKVCPTKSIDGERFLVHAEKCLTYFNEDERNFPEWLNKNWHNALVGCMKCQVVCPENKDYLKKSEFEIHINQRQTEMILNKVPFIRLSPDLQKLLDNFDLTEYYEMLPRNLAALINKRSS